MRASLWVLGVVVAAAHAAEASTVVVLSDPAQAPALGSALQVTLAGRGVAIATLPAPDGGLRLDRAAAAQRAAISSNADAALWIDSAPDATEVCAVSADGRFFRHAPLPVGEGDTPRMFAAIATSLLDELMAPPDAPALDVDMHIHLDPHGGVVAGAPPPIGVAPSVAADTSVEPRLRANRTLIELGPMVSPLTVGGELGFMAPVTPAYRIGAFGILDVMPWNSNHIVGGGGAEIRHVGSGTHHFDVGPLGGIAGLLDAGSGGIVFAGARLSYVWEGASTSTSFSLVPVVFTDGKDAAPGIYASLRLGIPL